MFLWRNNTGTNGASIHKSGGNMNIFIISPQKQIVMGTHKNMFSWRNKKKYQYLLVERKKKEPT